MAKPNPRAMLVAAAGYLRSHPGEVVRAVKGATSMRVGVPLDAVRYLVRELAVGKKAPQDVVIEAAPPGIRVAASFRVMGSTIRARLTLFIESVDVRPDQVLLAARVADMHLEVLEGSDSAVAGLIQSGALDLSKPGNLVAFLPNRPPMIVDAKDDSVVVDLLKVPRLARNRTFQKALAVVTPVVTIASIRTSDDHLDVHLRASPSRLAESIAAARA